MNLKQYKIKLIHLILGVSVLVSFFGAYASAFSPYMRHEGMEKIFERYLQDKSDNTDRWMTFMTILSTIFAVFFVYSGFKIDDTVEKVKSAEKKIVGLADDMQDIQEYTVQLEYCMSLVMQKQYTKSIDALEVLRKESFVWNDSSKRDTCSFFLAHCYYERGSINNSLDDLALAVQYINDAKRDDELDPFKREIIEKFNELDKIHGKHTS